MARGWIRAAGATMAIVIGVAGVARAGVIDALKAMTGNRPPATAFAQTPPPPAPDYATAAAWASLPDASDGADRTPAGVDAIDQRRAAVDVFYVYPTVFFSQTAWNADIADPAYRADVDALPLTSQASVFNGCCAIYAPHYRQMTLGGFVHWSDDAAAAMDLAYGDVARAFDRFLTQYNRGRPFIIAGHSQGARLARRLIAERIAGTPLARRFVGGYLIGHWIERDWFAGLRGIGPCTSSAQQQCIVTYSTFGEGQNAPSQRRLLGRTSGYAPEQSRAAYSCTNILDLAAGTRRVAAGRNAGGWLPAGGAAGSRLDPAVVSARCADGALYISRPPQGYRDRVIPFGNYHNVDYNLFWMNLRRDAVERAAAALRQPR